MVIRNRNPHRNRPSRPVLARNRPNYPNGHTTSSSHTNSWLWVFFVWAFMSALDIFLTFRVEFFYPVFLAIQETHYLWKTSTLSSLFFLVVTISADMTIFSLWKNSENLFIFAGFLVWIHVIFSGLESKSPTLYTALGSVLIVLFDFLLYSQTRLHDGHNYFKADFKGPLRPVAAHCIGYPLVSIGYCLKRYMAYLLRLRKQNEVEAKNKFYYNLLYEALPPSSYNHLGGGIWDKDLLELDPDRDDGESSTSSRSERESKPAEKDLISWTQRVKEIIQDLTCFSRPSRSHLLTVKEPPRNHPPVAKTTSATATRPVRFIKWLDSMRSWLREFFSSSSSSSSTAPSVHNSGESTPAPPSSPPPRPQMSSRSRPAARSTHSNSSKTPNAPAKDNNSSPPKNQNSENCQKDSKKSKDESDGQYSRHTPTKKEKSNHAKAANGEHLYTQIKNPELSQDGQSPTQQPNSPSRSDDTAHELGRVRRETEKLKRQETQLRVKIDDLTQHEEFTKKELEDVKKRDAHLRGQLKGERDRVNEYKTSLKEKTEETRLLLHSLNDSNTENERLRQQLKKIESERELLIGDSKSRNDEVQQMRLELGERDNKLQNMHRLLEEERGKIKNSQEKLTAESRMKIKLLEQLNNQQQEIEDLRRRSTRHQRLVINDFQ